MPIPGLDPQRAARRCGRRGGRLGAVAVLATVHAVPLGAQPLTPAEGVQALQRCIALDDAAKRLACYDRLAGRPLRQPTEKDASAAPPLDGSAETSGAIPAAAARVPTGPALRPTPGFLSAFWELDRNNKRGTFNFIGYRPNFFLPLHHTDRINRTPQSPTREAVTLPDYRPLEAKLQLSLRTKVAQSVLLPDADLWFGYTQQSLWQLWNTRGSAPFRNTDYEPEVIYVVPVPATMQGLPGGWQWKFVQAGFAHQSNGQAKPLSRSWNRVYAGAGFERGDYSIIARSARRLPEDDDDNPDLTDYRGRGDVLVQWTPGLATAALLWRTTFKSFKRGALQLDWTYPVDSDSPAGLHWYVQLFTGYGETLTDYNVRQTSIGLGVTLFEF